MNATELIFLALGIAVGYYAVGHYMVAKSPV